MDEERKRGNNDDDDETTKMRSEKDVKIMGIGNYVDFIFLMRSSHHMCDKDRTNETSTTHIYVVWTSDRLTQLVIGYILRRGVKDVFR